MLNTSLTQTVLDQIQIPSHVTGTLSVHLSDDLLLDVVINHVGDAGDVLQADNDREGLQTTKVSSKSARKLLYQINDLFRNQHLFIVE